MGDLDIPRFLLMWLVMLIALNTSNEFSLLRKLINKINKKDVKKNIENDVGNDNYKYFKKRTGKNRYNSEKMYQDADCWYNIETMKQIKDSYIWDFSKRIDFTDDSKTLWIMDDARDRKIVIKGMKLKDSAKTIIYDNRLNDSFGISKKTLFCPESDQTLELDPDNLVRFCLFLREKEIQAEKIAEKQLAEEIEQKRRLETERKKDIIRDKHNLVTRFMQTQILEDASKSLDNMPFQLREDYETYMGILETIRKEREEENVKNEKE